MKEHKCKENKDRYGFDWQNKIYKDGLDEWNIEADNNYHVIHGLTYCPFCGKKL